MIRLHRAAKANPQQPGVRGAPKFDVFAEGEGLILRTSKPLHDGARRLLDLGYDPDELMTVRVEGRDYDSFKPIKIGEAAKWTVSESERQGLRRQKYVNPAHRFAQG